MTPLLLSACLTGLAGSSHCLAMCGGIGLHLGLGSGKRFLLFYHLGRILSYALLAWFLANLLWLLGWRLHLGSGLWPRLMVALWMLLLALQAFFPRWPLWRHGERILWRLWRPIQPWTQAFLPVRRRSDALLVGLFWGLLPCGLIYSALGLALASAHPWQAALVMLAFGLGTLPALWLFQYLSQPLRPYFERHGRRVYGGLLLLCALWTAAPFWLHGSASGG